MMPTRGLLLAAMAVMCVAGRAYAAGNAVDKEACIAAYEKAQVLRKNGKLVEAKEKLLVCAQATCPSIAQKDCATWLTEVSSSIPTVVVEATDANGHMTTAVRVLVDGDVLASSLEGTALPVNPGAHQFRFEVTDASGAKAQEQSVLVLQGDRNRKISVTFAPEKPQTPVKSEAQVQTQTQTQPAQHEEPAPVHKSPPIAGFVFAGAAVVGLASFTFFGLTGVSKENSLRNTCAPACARSDVDGVLNRYRVADVSLVIGVISGIAATWFWWPRSEPAHVGRTTRVIPTVGTTGGGVSVEIPFL